MAVVVVVRAAARAAATTYEVTAEFENASQLVKGNEVVVGGAAAGTVEGDRARRPRARRSSRSPSARTTRRCAAGTTATVRSPSLSQIAGRQVQLTLPARLQAGEEIASGGALDQAETVSAVDLDQIFNTLVAEDDQGLQARDPGLRALLRRASASRPTRAFAT